jgi:outer membrane receptor protein involved in Fe transport
VEVYSRFADKQDRLSASDKSDPRMDPNGTSGWITFNARGMVKLNNDISFSSGVENIFDVGYREHGSGVDAPGINFYLGIEVVY